MSKLRFFYDQVSQPCRMLYIFLEKTNIPYEPKFVDLSKDENLTNEFKAINRFQKVPCIIDKDLHLAESVAIVRYLAEKYHVPEHWYPRDNKKRARVDEYLEWQHVNTRTTCGLYFHYTWLRPQRLGTKVIPDRAEKLRQKMDECLNFIETEYLGGKNDFLVGNEISVADLFAACEIEQPKLAGFDTCAGRPKLAAWLERVRETTNPYFDDAKSNRFEELQRIFQSNKMIS